MIVIDPLDSSLLSPDRHYDSDEFELFKEQQVALFQSPDVLSYVERNTDVRLIADKHNQSVPEFLLHRVKIDFEGRSMIRVSMSSREEDVADAEAVVNSLTSAFMRHAVTISHSRVNQRLGLLEAESESAEEFLEDMHDSRDKLLDEIRQRTEDGEDTRDTELQLALIDQDIEIQLAKRRRLRNAAMELATNKLAQSRVKLLGTASVMPLMRSQ